MPYSAYKKPSTAGITMASGLGSQQVIPDGVLSFLIDVQVYASDIGAKILNAATDPSLGMTFAGIKTTDAAQPWVIQWIPGGSWWFAGTAINQRAEATSIFTGFPSADYPGAFKKQSSGAWVFVPQPLPPVTSPPLPNPADVAGWLAAMNVPTLSLTDVMKALAQIGLAVGAKAPR